MMGNKLWISQDSFEQVYLCFNALSLCTLIWIFVSSLNYKGLTKTSPTLGTLSYSWGGELSSHLSWKKINTFLCAFFILLKNLLIHQLLPSRREKVSLNPVKSRLCQVPGSGRDSRRIGYIKLTSFNQNASGK